MTEFIDRVAATPRIEVLFDKPDRRYTPDDRLAVRYHVDAREGSRVRAIEHSVVWYTEGKGEEDLGVHFFERIVDKDCDLPHIVDGDFATFLPKSPLSYEGVIVKVRWCVRVRIFFQGSKDYVSEHVFEMGDVPPAQMPSAR